MHVRVAISQKANEIDLPDTTKIVTKLLINAAIVLLLLGDLPTLDLYYRQSCVLRARACVDRRHRRDLRKTSSCSKSNTEAANKDGTWLREISSCCCLTTAGKTRQLLLNKIYIPFLPSL